MSSNNIFSNFIWRFIERCGSQAITLVLFIVLTRLLEPEDFGLIAIVTVFTTILQVFVDSGMGNALIQKKNADDLDFSTVFYLNMTICILLYFLIFFMSPFIARFYEMPELEILMKVLCLNIVISGLKNVQQAYAFRNLMFKKHFFAALAGTIASAIFGVLLAYGGFGAWALVGQTLGNSVVGTVVLWFVVKWRPKLIFSFERLKELFSYGWKILIASLIDTFYKELGQLIIGKLYNVRELAFYNRGEQFPKLIVSNINTSIDSVLFPTMSAAQDNIERLRAMTKRAIKTSSYIMTPMMMGLAVCAEPLVILIFTDKWLPCVPLLRIFCIVYAFYPIHTANLNAIKAIGRSDLFLKLEVIKKVIGLLTLLCTMWISVKAIAYGFIFTAVMEQIINSWPNRKLINYKYSEQILDMMPSILLSVFMGTTVYSVSLLNIGVFVTLMLQVSVGIIIYLIGSKLFKLESYNYVKSAVFSLLKK